MPIIYKGRVFSVEVETRRFPNGRDHEVAIVRHSPSVVLIPVEDDGRVVLITQYRPALDRDLWELPAGGLEPGESAEDAARRECEEEIGRAPARVQRLGAWYPTPGYCDEEMIFFRATGLRAPAAGSTHAPDEDEDITVHPTTVAEAVALLQDMRRALGLTDSVFIAGVIGPRRDGYDPRGAPRAAEARDYHAAQADILAGLGVDLLYAPTFASIEELVGVAQAMSATGVPYVVAPVLDLEGTLPDGTRLEAAVARVDTETTSPPLHYMIGCVHPTHFPASVPRERVAGLKANAG